ncbi:MAG TPA: hypothetical protein VMT68_10375 [Caulobacteraceae bacterium]|nr:hypothetical protein [Caulobacteraceae bacterium]
MGRLALMLWLWPAIALADPQGAATQSAVTQSAAAKPATPAGAATPAYAVQPPAASHGRLSAGWGLYATWQGRSTDLGVSGMDWADDPRVQPNEVEAGYGWRGGRAAALVGFEQHDYGPKAPRPLGRASRDPNEAPNVQSSGVLGFSVVLHGR